MGHSSFSIRKPGTMRVFRPSTGRRLQNAEKAYLKLLRRKKKEGETLWLKKTIKRTEAVILKAGIKLADVAAKQK